MSVKRYWKDTGQVPSEVGENPQGDYVRYKEFAEVVTRSEALEAARKWEQDHLWAFLRSVLLQGQDIALDYREKGYELMSARVDEAAREREDELNKHRFPEVTPVDGGCEHGG